MTTTHSQAQRRVDLGSLALLLVGLVSGILAYLFVTQHGTDPLLLVPSVVAVTTGATHLTRRVAPRS